MPAIQSSATATTVRLIHQQSTGHSRYRRHVDYPKLETALLKDVDDTFYFGANCRSCSHASRLSLSKVRGHLGVTSRWRSWSARMMRSNSSRADAIHRLSTSSTTGRACSSLPSCPRCTSPTMAVVATRNLFQKTAQIFRPICTVDSGMPRPENVATDIGHIIVYALNL
jgi:hypothetical protein